MRADPLMKRLVSSGEIRIGFQRRTPPFSYAAAHAPWPSGYSVALATEAMGVLASSIGVPLRIHPVEVTSTTRTDMLLQGEIDIECGSTTITAERKRHVAFSRPIFHTAHRVALKAERSLHDACPIRVTGIGESTSHRALLEATATFAPDRALKFVGCPSIREAFDAFVQDDDIDAIVADEVILAGLLSGSGPRGITMVEPRIGGEHYGFMMRHGVSAHGGPCTERGAGCARFCAIVRSLVRPAVARTGVQPRAGLRAAAQASGPFGRRTRARPALNLFDNQIQGSR